LVACAGIVTLDHIFQIDALPTHEGKYSATGHLTIGGGVAANAAAAVVKLGGAASFIGCVGDDDAGDNVIAQFLELGIATDSMQRIANHSTPISFILVDRAGQRELVNFVPDDFFSSANPWFADDVGEADVVLVDCRWPAGAVHSLGSARERSLPSVVDVDRPIDAAPHTETGQIMDLGTHLIFSRSALTATMNDERLVDALRSAAERSGAWVAVTDGERGVSWVEDGRVRHQPAFHVDAVDTLGAGDVFHGAFALALAEGRGERDAVRFASAAAALKCTSFGGRAGIPDRAAVDALLVQAPPAARHAASQTTETAGA
jgi:sulfofructose kinase